MITQPERQALVEAAEKAIAQQWRVRTNRHTATNGDEWGWLSDGPDRANYMGGLKVTWEGQEAQNTARFIVRAPAAILSLEAALTAAEGEVERLKDTLKFYADTISYALTQVREPRSAVHGDEGRRAAAALAYKAHTDTGEQSQ